MAQHVTVQELIDTLMQVEDKTLPVAVSEGEDEYWGGLFTSPSLFEIRTLQIHGPKEFPVKCFYIGVW